MTKHNNSKKQRGGGWFDWVPKFSFPTMSKPTETKKDIHTTAQPTVTAVQQPAAPALAPEVTGQHQVAQAAQVAQVPPVPQVPQVPQVAQGGKKSKKTQKSKKSKKSKSQRRH